MKPISPYIENNLTEALRVAAWLNKATDPRTRLTYLSQCLDLINMSRRLVKEERKLAKKSITATSPPCDCHGCQALKAL